MEPDREIGLAPEAEREMRVVGIGADCPVEPLAEPVVLVRERLDTLPHRRFEPALAAYKKGYESVPGSSLSEDDKKTWLGRLHHGTARTHAKMGRHKEAMEGVEQVRQMILTGGETGRQYWPAYHYLAGYVKLEMGDGPAALEHLLQASNTDPFHLLLLGRAYEKAGRKAEAKAAYERVVASQLQGIERALAFPEAKKKALSL